jgi:hypothetical protein
LPVLLIKPVISIEKKSFTYAIVASVLEALLKLLFVLNSLLNPIIYAFRNVAIRAAVLKIGYSLRGSAANT